MNMFKKFLAMFLALCMLVSAVPVTAFSAETDSPNPVVTEPSEEATVPTQVTTESTEMTTEPTETTTEPTEVTTEVTTESDEVTAESAEETTESTEVNADLTDELMMDLAAAYAATREKISEISMGTKPASGTTTGEPFPQGAGDSNSFRIPALVTLANGNLVAAADARWNSTLDNGGIDTIVSCSYDSGDTWTYSFANYLGDNGNTYNNGSTCFIDPALAVSGNTVYMLCDLYPYGVAIAGTSQQTAKNAVGFNSDGKLLLSGDNHVSYSYYLDGNTICSSDGTPVEGYTVDAYFNITADDGTTSNLFYSNSPYKVVRTGFLYLTKSTDAGATWSAPTLIPNVKTSSEMSCLVGPGRGLVTAKGTIVFPVYTYAGSTSSQLMSFLYSTDNGATWSRSADCGVRWSSEAAVVELTDGTLRFFYRNDNAVLCYVDYSFTSGWGSQVKTSVPTNSNTQLSAITYSKTIDGKQVILVSCPTGANSNGSADNSGSARLNGKIFAFTVESNKSLTKVGSVDVTTNNSQFMYSCLTELADGTVGILYEDKENAWGGGNDTYYYTMEYDEFNLTTDMGLTFDGKTSGKDEVGNVTITNTVEVRIPVGGTSETYTHTDGNHTATATIVDEDVATMNISGSGTAGVKEMAAVTTESFNSSKQYLIYNNRAGALLTDESYTEYYVYAGTVTGLKVEGTASEDSTELWTITPSDNGYTIMQNGKYLTFGYASAAMTSEKTVVELSYNNGWYISLNGNYLSDYAGNALDGAFGYNTYDDGGNPWTIYEVSGGTTSVSFTGVSAGTTTAVVGTAQYNITVYEEVDVKINYIYNGKIVATGTVKAPSDAAADATVTLPNSVTDGTKMYKVNNTTLKLTNGVSATYSVMTTLLEGTEITIRENETDEISVNLDEGQYVEWTCDDSSYVGVAGKYDAGENKYTNTAVILGQNITSEPVLVSGTVYNADGSVAGTYKWLVTVTAGSADTNTGSRKIHVEVDTMDLCTVYYSINAGELIKVNGTGVLIDETVTGHFNLMFFAAPDEGTALTFMGLSNTANQYYALSNGNPDGTGSDAWPFDDPNASTIPATSGDSAWKDGHGFRWALLEGNYSIEQMKIMFSQAIALGCDGATNFTKNGNGDNYSTVATFKADKLATIDKSVEGILPGSGKQADYRTYTEGMEAKAGEYVYFKISVTQERPKAWQRDSTTKAALVYENVVLTDTVLPGAYFYDKELDRADSNITNPSNEYEGLDGLITNTDNQKQTMNITADLNAEWGADVTQRVLTYYLVYEIKSTDSKLYNTADISYAYGSYYSSDSKELEANAEAEIAVAGAEIPDYVVDFGLPLVIEGLTERQLPAAVIGETNAMYGTVCVEKSEDNTYKITYTPTKIMQGADSIKIYGTYTNGTEGTATRLINDFEIYPATTVHYEESFITWDPNWSGGKEPITVGVQTTEQLNVNTESAATHDSGKQYNYGYDPVYVNTTGASNGTNATASETGATGSFTFTGNGIQIFANATEKSGYVSVEVKNSSGKIVNVSMVDTVVDEGTTGVTSGQSGNLYGLPIVSLVDLQNMKHDTYTVTLTKIMDTETVYIDGIRVFNTMDDSTIFANDLEDNPEFYELRDYVLNALSIGTDSKLTADALDAVVDQVYAAISSDAESPASAVITSGSNSVITDTDTAQDLLDNGPKNELYLYAGQTLTFKVKTSRIMQIGLKAPQGATAASISIDGGTANVQDVKSSVDMFYDLKAADTEDDYTISIQNTGSKILSVTLLKVCDDPSFAFTALEAEDIEAVLMNVYGLGESENPTEPEPPVETEAPEETTEPTESEGTLAPVEPNEPGSPSDERPDDSEEDSEQSEAKATLNIVFVNVRGKKVATATLTKIGTENGRCVFSLAEIRGQAPSGRYAVWFLPIVVTYGNVGTIVVPVI